MKIKKININESCQSKIKELVEVGSVGPIAQFGGGIITSRDKYAKPTLQGKACTSQDIGAERKPCVK